MFSLHLGVFVAVLPVFPVLCHRSKWMLADHAEDLLALLKPGDLLEFDRGTYKHWAVYVGTRHDVRLHSWENTLECPYCGGFLGGASLLRRVGSLFSGWFFGAVQPGCRCERHFVVHRANPADSNILGVLSRSQSASKGAFGIGSIILEDLMDVWAASPARKNNQFDSVRPESISASDALKRAFERLVRKGTEILHDEYNVVLNNCEHFAVWVRYGKKDSPQVTRYALFVAFALLILGFKLWIKRPLGAFFFTSGAVLLVGIILAPLVGVMDLLRQSV